MAYTKRRDIHELWFKIPLPQPYALSTSNGDTKDLVMLKCYLIYDSPDATASCVVIQCTGSVPPCDIASRLWYIADYTLQLYCTTCFVELVTSRGTVLIDYFHLRHCTEID